MLSEDRESSSMSTDRPLHVAVARALGWTDLHSEEVHWPDLHLKEKTWWGVEPGGLKLKVPRYDSSWCSAGPLSERLKIGVMWDHGQWIATVLTEEGHDQYAGGERPTEAISRLVVHLFEKGLLKI